MARKKNLHMGRLVGKRLKEKGLTKAAFARAINRHRTTVYNILDRPYIDIELLQSISAALDYDFVKEIYNNSFSENRFTYAFCMVMEIEKNRSGKIDLEDELQQAIRERFEQKQIELVTIKLCISTNL